MADARKKNGGARKGAGRKPKTDEEELAALMNKSWPLARRVKAIKKHAAQAEEGNVKSFMGLMSYAYGKPIEHQRIAGEGGGPVILKVVYDK